MGKPSDIPDPQLDDEDIEHILRNEDELFNHGLIDLGDNETVHEKSKRIEDTTPEIEDIVNPSSDFNAMLSPLQYQDEEIRPEDINKQEMSTQLVRRPHTPYGLYQNMMGNSAQQGGTTTGISNVPGTPTSMLPNALMKPISTHYNGDASANLIGNKIRDAINGQGRSRTGTNSARRGHNQKTRPTFVNKVWNMVNDDNNAELIRWSSDGLSIVINNREELVREILPKYFKHSNFASFVRQLNMYGWHKVQDIRSGSIQNSVEDKWQFENENFIKGREDLLENIVRQKSQTSQGQGLANGPHGTRNIQDTINSIASSLNFNSNLLLTGNDSNNGDKTNTNGPTSVNVAALLGELEQLKYNQVAISKDLLRVSKDNEMLWKENMLARERHRNQQDALEKILRFLASLVPHIDQKMLTDRILSSTGNIDDAATNMAGNIPSRFEDTTGLDLKGSDATSDSISGSLNNINDFNSNINNFKAGTTITTATGTGNASRTMPTGEMLPNDNIKGSGFGGLGGINTNINNNIPGIGGSGSGLTPYETALGEGHEFPFELDSLHDPSVETFSPLDDGGFTSKPRFLLKSGLSPGIISGEGLDSGDSSGRISEIPYHESETASTASATPPLLPEIQQQPHTGMGMGANDKDDLELQDLERSMERASIPPLHNFEGIVNELSPSIEDVDVDVINTDKKNGNRNRGKRSAEENDDSMLSTSKRPHKTSK
ncbi:hypothetical protein Kpol_1033p46 [Vanderwaltozyma polyspora DSM 70294]|uniref:Heat shock transcription factor n=1 Tax=Vanderwaltozyma polyspora (strain ATCC 22028 / DSM 70294 / BCRC 21397 / CBS 2163 / NBRC 10782 / NRRL Y-8283 / UCD 57-17) TaxID=436907 RepID=A7TJ41_VANPO|nr:uncharacterized protein Kpol_1033p46 [Vanderwaltozyma polyspora DSM 70294]EDO17740.1 hypothetical protein Kpol_1033p46 [Vanderwaltozyma polyspora DSM 70294]